MTPALKIKGISKRYRIGRARRDTSLREAITQGARDAWRGPRDAAAPSEGEADADTLWALRDVSLEIGQGEIVGIIGRNGAGKSTLLKILSRVTSPTEGEIEIYGGMASLLEVGTGFHPELTGRENIFLNGSILGMSRQLIRSRFDEIVAFSEIGRFLDTPVKYYSSGMYLRLAFAVAAHLESEILLLDEVLAVGDVGFQKKCLAKMNDVAGQGRTVVFVSHNMAAVRQLCPRAVLVENGRVTADGRAAETLRRFNSGLRGLKLDATSNLAQRLDGNHSGKVRFTSFRVEDARGNEKYDFVRGETIRIAIEYEAFEDAEDLCFFFALCSDTTSEFITSVRYVLSENPLRKGDKGRATIEFPDVQLLPRDYTTYAWLGSRLGKPYDRIDYSQTSCPPITILFEKLGPEQIAGYFVMPSRLVAG